MAFKKFTNYLEEKQGVFFVLRNDLDFADVVFLYKSYEDMMVCDAHYLKTSGYEGYVQCCMDDYKQCPACSYGELGIQKQSKLIIPMFNLTKNALEFWDRNVTFENVMNQSVFKNYPNPSEFVFRVTRHGQPRDTNTRYEITAQGRNVSYPYEKILADYNITFPEGYERVCRSMTPDEMEGHLNNHGPSYELKDYSYTPVPRGSFVPEDAQVGPSFEPTQLDIPTPVYNEPPTDLPEYKIDVPEGVESSTAVPADTEVPVESTGASDDSLPDVDF